MKVEIKCEQCSKPVLRERSEVNRSQRLGRRQFCGKACKAKAIPNETFHSRPENLVPGNRLDEFSPFKHHLHRLKNRRHEITITLVDLKEQWDRQGGRCALTGWVLEIDPTSKQGGGYHPRKASLDRIDSTQGYHPDNVQWLCMMANHAKNSFSMEDVREFAQAVVAHTGS